MSGHTLLGIDSRCVASSQALDPISGSGAIDAASRRVRPFNPWRIAARLFHEFPIAAWIAFDTFLIWVVMLIGYRSLSEVSHVNHVEAWRATLIFAGSFAVCSLIFGLHERETFRSYGRILTRILLTTMLGTVLAYTVIYVGMYLLLSRRLVALTVASYLVVGASVRMFTSYTVHKVRRRVLVVGSRGSCVSFINQLTDGILSGHHVVGYVCDPGGDEPAKQVPGKVDVAHIGMPKDIVRTCREMEIDDIVICNGMASDPEVMNWILPCLRMGARVTNEAIFYESACGRILVHEITPDWFLYADLKVHCDEYASLKRVFDVVVSVVGLIVALPLYPILALAIKLEDGGPVFYCQDRVGRGGEIFKLYKFRTMKPDAECGESVWASRNDSRITRVGRVLRLARLDEFPQFLNILMGSMSVVGPRPERPDLVMKLARIIPYWSERNLVKPGLTGWAQISFRYGNTVEDARRKLQYDLYYLKNMNLELDIIILFRTIGTFLRGAC